MTTANEFKSNFMENNQGWNQPTFDQDIKHNSRVHLRHFSANDSNCIRNNSYPSIPDKQQR